MLHELYVSKPVVLGSGEPFLTAAEHVVDRLQSGSASLVPPLDPSRSFLNPLTLVIIEAFAGKQARNEIARLESVLKDPIFVLACHFDPTRFDQPDERVSLLAIDDDLTQRLLDIVRWSMAGYCVQPRRQSQASRPSVPICDDEEARLRLLSPTECKVLMQLAEAKSNKVIARSLRISDNTVRVHMRSIFIKLGVENRTEAALLATRFRYHDFWTEKVVTLMSAV